MLLVLLMDNLLASGAPVPPPEPVITRNPSAGIPMTGGGLGTILVDEGTLKIVNSFTDPLLAEYEREEEEKRRYFEEGIKNTKLGDFEIVGETVQPQQAPRNFRIVKHKITDETSVQIFDKIRTIDVFGYIHPHAKVTHRTMKSLAKNHPIAATAVYGITMLLASKHLPNPTSVAISGGLAITESVLDSIRQFFDDGNIVMGDEVLVVEPLDEDHQDD